MRKSAIILIPLLTVGLILGMIGCGGGEEATPSPTPTAMPAVAVSIDVHAEVDAGSEVAARVNISHVADFDSYRFDVTYDPDVIEVIGAHGATEGVTTGVMDTTRIPVDRWKFAALGQGAIRVFGSVAEFGGVTGSGYLAEIHFRVVGSASDRSDINFSNGWLGDFSGDEITPVEWVGGSVRVVGVPPTHTPTPIGQLPCRFYGKVQIDGADVPGGTTVSAVIEGDIHTTFTPSIYGTSTYALTIVPTEGLYYAEQTPITLLIGDLIADQTATWVTGGNFPLDLSAATG